MTDNNKPSDNASPNSITSGLSGTSDNETDLSSITLNDPNQDDTLKRADDDDVKSPSPNAKAENMDTEASDPSPPVKIPTDEENYYMADGDLEANHITITKLSGDKRFKATIETTATYIIGSSSRADIRINTSGMPKKAFSLTLALDNEGKQTLRLVNEATDANYSFTTLVRKDGERIPSFNITDTTIADGDSLALPHKPSDNLETPVKITFHLRSSDKNIMEAQKKECSRIVCDAKKSLNKAHAESVSSLTIEKRDIDNALKQALEEAMSAENTDDVVEKKQALLEIVANKITKENKRKAVGTIRADAPSFDPPTSNPPPQQQSDAIIPHVPAQASNNQLTDDGAIILNTHESNPAPIKPILKKPPTQSTTTVTYGPPITNYSGAYPPGYSAYDRATLKPRICTVTRHFPTQGRGNPGHFPTQGRGNPGQGRGYANLSRRANYLDAHDASQRIALNNQLITRGTIVVEGEFIRSFHQEVRAPYGFVDVGITEDAHCKYETFTNHHLLRNDTDGTWKSADGMKVRVHVALAEKGPHVIAGTILS